MSRIHVTGNAGSGKSSFAKRVGNMLDIPVYGLDEIVWQSGWVKTSTNERKQLEYQLVTKPRWVIEGVSDTVRRAADVVVLLDVGRPTSYWRCLRRNWRYLLHSRPGLPPNCPEILIIPRLAMIIWNFPQVVQPQIIADMKASQSEFFHIRNSVQLELAIARLGM